MCCLSQHGSADHCRSATRWQQTTVNICIYVSLSHIMYGNYLTGKWFSRCSSQSVKAEHTTPPCIYTVYIKVTTQCLIKVSTKDSLHCLRGCCLSQTGDCNPTHQIKGFNWPTAQVVVTVQSSAANRCWVVTFSAFFMSTLRNHWPRWALCGGSRFIIDLGGIRANPPPLEHQFCQQMQNIH